jgi:tight adherence protein C
MFTEEIDHMIVLVVSSLLAMGSFVAVALPYLNRNEKKERYRSVIEKKRKALFEQTKERNIYSEVTDTQSVRQSLAFFFKIQKVFGELGEKVRDQMLQAGVRDPKAPFIYLVARGTIPIVLMLFSWVILANGNREITQEKIFLIMVGLGALGFFLPRILLKNHIIKRQGEINLTFPDGFGTNHSTGRR